MKKMSFLMACKDFFGLKDGQTLTEFGQEVKKLTDADRNDLISEFAKVGYEITS